MNGHNEYNKRQGYWEEDIGLFIWKGNYINGLEEGMWECYRSNQLESSTFFENGKSLYTREYVKNKLLYKKHDYSTNFYDKVLHQEETFK